jgi:hypothetical protein
MGGHGEYSMGYDKSRLVKIELWMRRLAWFYAAAIGLGILAAVSSSIKIWNNPESLGYYYGTNFYSQWTKYLNLTENIRSVLVTVFVFLMLQGAAKIIRYLLALADNIYARYSGAARSAD